MAAQVDFQTYVAISEVKARYCRMMDTKDWAGFADLFTDDFELDTSYVGGPPPIRGREAAVAAIRSWVETAKTAHQVHSPEMKIEGDVAHVIWAMQDRVIWAPDCRPVPDMGGHTGYGHYHERYVRKDGRWRIAAQRLTRLIEDFHPPAPEA
ncbi:MAG: nuclear transport factor 2 family protein [Rhodospirillaceae bacterium]|nr:MAG: nuclear transport factor 2 family protein [Rhodospirillaceae bacterium]